MTKNKEQRLTIYEASQILGINPKLIYGYIKRGQLPVYRLSSGSPQYVLKKDIENEDFMWTLEQNRKKGKRTKSINL